MEKVLIACCVASFLFLAANSEQKYGYCGKIQPLKDSNWTKLIGDWYHLMYQPGTPQFLNCRRMQISEVDTEKKTVNMNLDHIIYTSYHKRFSNNYFYFRWFEEPGVIYTTMKRPSEYQGSKSQFSKQKKSFDKGTANSRKFCHTLLSTDYTNYMIIVQCRQNDDPQVWISVKKMELDLRVADSIKDILLQAGIDSSSMDLNVTLACRDH